jgi:GNAT superfamily N-acetyltransferase
MELRKACISDIELLKKLRVEFLTEDKGYLSPDEINKIQEQLGGYFQQHIPAGSFIGIIAEKDNQVLAVAFLSIFERPANPSFITGKIGTISNVFTYPEFRRKGIATKLINRIIDEAKQCNVSKIELYATNNGRCLYEKIGFYESSYTAMALEIK